MDSEDRLDDGKALVSCMVTYRQVILSSMLYDSMLCILLSMSLSYGALVTVFVAILYPFVCRLTVATMLVSTSDSARD